MQLWYALILQFAALLRRVTVARATQSMHNSISNNSTATNKKFDNPQTKCYASGLSGPKKFVSLEKRRNASACASVILDASRNVSINQMLNDEDSNTVDGHNNGSY